MRAHIAALPMDALWAIADGSLSLPVTPAWPDGRGHIDREWEQVEDALCARVASSDIARATQLVQKRRAAAARRFAGSELFGRTAAAERILFVARLRAVPDAKLIELLRPATVAEAIPRTRTNGARFLAEAKLDEILVGGIRAAELLTFGERNLELGAAYGASWLDIARELAARKSKSGLSVLDEIAAAIGPEYASWPDGLDEPPFRSTPLDHLRAQLRVALTVTNAAAAAAHASDLVARTLALRKPVEAIEADPLHRDWLQLSAEALALTRIYPDTIGVAIRAIKEREHPDDVKSPRASGRTHREMALARLVLEIRFEVTWRDDIGAFDLVGETRESVERRLAWWREGSDLSDETFYRRHLPLIEEWGWTRTDASEVVSNQVIVDGWIDKWRGPFDAAIAAWRE
jgi:hypothetical protein